MMYKVLAASCLLAVAPSLAVGQAIEDVAPENAVVVLGVRDADTLVEALRHHPLMALWSGEAWRDAAGAANPLADLLPAPLAEALREMRDEAGQMPAPKGPTGVALFTAMNPQKGVPEPQFLAYGDFGDGAGAFMDRLGALVGRAADGSGMTVRKGELNGAPLLSVTLPPPPQAEPDEPGMGGGMNPLDMMKPDAERFRVDTFHVARSGRSIMVSSERDSLRRGLDALTGEADLGSVRDNRAFSGAMKQIGESEVYGVVVMRDMMELVLGPEMMGFAMMFRPTARAIFGDVQAMGYGMSGGGPAGDPATQRFTVYMPNGKQGLASLVDKPLQQMEPPSFAGGDVLGFTAMSLQLSRLVPMINGVMQSNPMLAAQVAEPWARMRPQIEQVLGTLGNQVYVAQTLDPTLPQGVGTLIAVECAQPEAFTSRFAAMASEWGMEKGDEGGRAIYSLAAEGQAGGMGAMPRPEMAIGIGDRFVFAGIKRDVQSALRGDGRAGAAPEVTALLNRGRTLLPDEPVVAWGLTDPQRLIELTRQMNLAQVDPEAMEAFSGLSVWYMQSTPDGFVSVSKQLPAPQAVHVESN